ncbi:MAG: T9SS type A sorting domain-containing protein [Chitinophagaceae bacterium]|nr:T9SS type A sorting domain-containing protein [Chitinophagaceae bacterium]
MNKNNTRRNRFFSAVIAVVAFSSFSANGQIITTVAGNGKLGATGDDDYAAYSTVNITGGLKHDNNGNLFISDQYNNKIRKIDARGVITTLAGFGSAGMSGDGGPAVKAKVSAPMGLAIDKIGNLYFADSKNNRIRKIDTAGVISTVAGNGMAGFAGDDSAATLARLSLPKGIAFDSKGNMFIADCNNHKIRKVDTKGIITTVAGADTTFHFYYGDGIKAVDAYLYQPSDVIVLNNDEVVFTDAANNVIRKIDTAGIITTIAGSGNNAGYGGDNGPAKTSQLNYPVSLALDRTGNIYFADYFNNRVRKIGTDGKINTIAGDGTADRSHIGDGGLAVDACVTRPTCVAVDSAGNLFIGEKANRVRYVYLAEPFETDTLTIFPNPCTSNTNVFMSSIHEELANIFVYDMTGRLVKQSVGPTNKYINISFDVPGLYTIYAVSKRAVWTGRLNRLPQ